MKSVGLAPTCAPTVLIRVRGCLFVFTRLLKISRKAWVQPVAYRLAILEAMRCIEWIFVKDYVAGMAGIAVVLTFV